MNIIFSILGLLISFSATAAEWVPIADWEKATTYTDTKSIAKSPKHGIVKVWLLVDFKDIQQSILSEDEFDCDHFKTRMLRYRQYMQSMARAPMLKDGENPSKEWQIPKLNSNRHNMYEAICGKEQ
jgi:hypothetical protein